MSNTEDEVIVPPKLLSQAEFTIPNSNEVFTLESLIIEFVSIRNSATALLASTNAIAATITAQAASVADALDSVNDSVATITNTFLAALRKEENLADLTHAPTARINLGLGSAATQTSTAFATAQQGRLAETAVQTDDFAQVAKDGSFNSLFDKPTLGTASTKSALEFATAAQGAKADTAILNSAGFSVDLSDGYVEITQTEDLFLAAGAETGKWLRVFINGTAYKLQLFEE